MNVLWCPIFAKNSQLVISTNMIRKSLWNYQINDQRVALSLGLVDWGRSRWKQITSLQNVKPVTLIDLSIYTKICFTMLNRSIFFIIIHEVFQPRNVLKMFSSNVFLVDCLEQNLISTTLKRFHVRPLDVILFNNNFQPDLI